MSNIKTRLQSVDAAKGLLMIIVCCLHIGNAAMSGAYAFRVHVGIFFTLAGYFYKPNQGYVHNLKRRFRQVFVPFVLYAIIGLLFVFLFENLRGNPISCAHLGNAIFRSIMDNWCLQPMGAHVTDGTIALYVLPMWFLGRLFVAELIMFAIADWALKSIKRMVIAVLSLLSVTYLWGILVGVHLPMQINTCFAVAAIMLAGAYARQQHVVEYIEQGWRKPRYWLIVMAMAAAYIGLMSLDISESRLVKGFFSYIQEPQELWTVYPWFVMVMCSTYLMLVVCAFLAKITWLRKILNRIGQSTLMILCFHQPLAYVLLTSIGIPLFISKDPAQFHLPARIGTIAVCIAVGIFLTRAKAQLDQRIDQKRQRAQQS